MSSDTTAGSAATMKPNCPEIKVIPARKRKVEENVYRMENSPRGKCIIINNFKFPNRKDWRHGSDVDVHRTKGLFNGLHFNCDSHSDLTAKQMKAVLEAAADPEHHKDADCLAVVLMSHGEWGYIYGADGMALHLHHDIYELFSNDNCPTLLAKPKIFIVQACRGPREDSGNLGPGYQADAIPAPLLENEEVVTQPSSVLNAAGCSDMYIIYASSPGYRAYRHVDDGSFFVKTLCEVFCEYACDEHLGDLVSRVHSIVKKYCASCMKGLRKQTPSVELIGWEKKLYFNPGLHGPCDEESSLPCYWECTIM